MRSHAKADVQKKRGIIDRRQWAYQTSIDVCFNTWPQVRMSGVRKGVSGSCMGHPTSVGQPLAVRRITETSRFCSTPTSENSVVRVSKLYLSGVHFEETLVVFGYKQYRSRKAGLLSRFRDVCEELRTSSCPNTNCRMVYIKTLEDFCICWHRRVGACDVVLFAGSLHLA